MPLGLHTVQEPVKARHPLGLTSAKYKVPNAGEQGGNAQHSHSGLPHLDRTRNLLRTITQNRVSLYEILRLDHFAFINLPAVT
jgi:hypothetical protein